MPRVRPSEVRCVCGHHRTLHAYTKTGLGPCSGLARIGAEPLRCECARFVTPGQRRYSEWQKRHAEAVAQARRELSEAQARTGSQED
jgi:hypothetical protein